MRLDLTEQPSRLAHAIVSLRDPFFDQLDLRVASLEVEALVKLRNGERSGIKSLQDKTLRWRMTRQVILNQLRQWVLEAVAHNADRAGGASFASAREMVDSASPSCRAAA